MLASIGNSSSENGFDCRQVVGCESAIEEGKTDDENHQIEDDESGMVEEEDRPVTNALESEEASEIERERGGRGRKENTHGLSLLSWPLW